MSQQSLRTSRPIYKHRQIRFLLPNGHFAILRRRVNTTDDLKLWIDAKSPLDCYYTTSLWRDPLGMHGHGTGGYMGSDWVVDIDAHETPLEAAAEVAKGVIGAIPDYTELAFTGRGFRVLMCGYRGIDMAVDAGLRQKLLRYLVDKFGVNGFTELPFDVPTFLDPYRVIRVLNTTNSKSGLPCVKISPLALDDLSWVDLLPRTKPHVAPSPGVARVPFKSEGITSTVLGTTNLHAIMFDFDEKTPDWVECRIAKLGRTYRLNGDFVLFQTSKKRYSVLSPIAVEEKRLLKILRASGCHPAFIDRFERFRGVFFRTEPKVSLIDGSMLAPKPEPVRVVSLNDGGYSMASLGHHTFLTKIAKVNGLATPARWAGSAEVTLRKYTKDANALIGNEGGLHP